MKRYEKDRMPFSSRTNSGQVNRAVFNLRMAVKTAVFYRLFQFIMYIVLRQSGNKLFLSWQRIFKIWLGCISPPWAERVSASSVFLAGLADALRNKTYNPAGVKREIIPKSRGAFRPLGIPTIRDRVV
jgi:hypothetical protein